MCWSEVGCGLRGGARVRAHPSVCGFGNQIKFILSALQPHHQYCQEERDLAGWLEGA